MYFNNHVHPTAGGSEDLPKCLVMFFLRVTPNIFCWFCCIAVSTPESKNVLTVNDLYNIIFNFVLGCICCFTPSVFLTVSLKYFFSLIHFFSGKIILKPGLESNTLKLCVLFSVTRPMLGFHKIQIEAQR